MTAPASFVASICAALAVLVALALPGVPGPAQAQPAAPPKDCTIVFGQGRNVAEADDAANKLWDDVNIAFNAHAAATLEAGGQRVVPLVARVVATDVAANIRQALARAAADGCHRIVETTVFADYESQTLVARIREYPILVDAGCAGDGPTLRIGAPGYVSERNFALQRTTLDRVRPGVLAAEMATELLQNSASAKP